MDELSYLQLLNDDNELLAAEDPLVGEFPNLVSILKIFTASFLKQLRTIRPIPSPVKQNQAHLKTFVLPKQSIFLDFQRLPVKKLKS